MLARTFTAVSGLLVLFTAAGVVAAEPVIARFFPIDELQVNAQWALPAPNPRVDPALNNLILAKTPVTEMRLTLPAEFVGKSVRIFQLIPNFVPGLTSGRGLEVEWTTQGVYIPGKARGGERVLFYEGTPTSTTLRDQVAYTLRIDSAYTTGPVRFQPTYEIERRR